MVLVVAVPSGATTTGRNHRCCLLRVVVGMVVLGMVVLGRVVVGMVVVVVGHCSPLHPARTRTPMGIDATMGLVVAAVVVAVAVVPAGLGCCPRLVMRQGGAVGTARQQAGASRVHDVVQAALTAHPVPAPQMPVQAVVGDHERSLRVAALQLQRHHHHHHQQLQQQEQQQQARLHVVTTESTWIGRGESAGRRRQSARVMTATMPAMTGAVGAGATTRL